MDKFYCAQSISKRMSIAFAVLWPLVNVCAGLAFVNVIFLFVCLGILAVLITVELIFIRKGDLKPVYYDLQSIQYGDVKIKWADIKPIMLNLWNSFCILLSDEYVEGDELKQKLKDYPTLPLQLKKAKELLTYIQNPIMLVTGCEPYRMVDENEAYRFKKLIKEHNAKCAILSGEENI